jgi:hypothetical protein
MQVLKTLHRNVRSRSNLEFLKALCILIFDQLSLRCGSVLIAFRNHRGFFFKDDLAGGILFMSSDASSCVIILFQGLQIHIFKVGEHRLGSRGLFLISHRDEFVKVCSCIGSDH